MAPRYFTRCEDIELDDSKEALKPYFERSEPLPWGTLRLTDSGDRFPTMQTKVMRVRRCVALCCSVHTKTVLPRRTILKEGGAVCCRAPIFFLSSFFLVPFCQANNYTFLVFGGSFAAYMSIIFGEFAFYGRLANVFECVVNADARTHSRTHSRTLAVAPCPSRHSVALIVLSIGHRYAVSFRFKVPRQLGAVCVGPSDERDATRDL